MATPPNPRIYMADDWSWAVNQTSAPTTSWQNFYFWDGHGNVLAAAGYGSGATRGYGFQGDSSSGVIGWTIVDLDTLVAITSATVGFCIGHNMRGITATRDICYLKDSSGGVVHVVIGTDASNHIIATRAGDNELLGTSSFILPPSASDGSGPTYHLEVIATIDNSAGTVQVWVNDILVLDLSGKDTRNGGTAVVGYLEWHHEGSRRSAEVIVHDGTARLGSQWRVGYVPVGSDGTYSNGTAVGAATFLQAVDDAPADGENEITTYGVLDSSGVPKKASFQSGTLPVTWLQIRDVHPQIVIEKSDGGTNTAKTGLKSGATEVYTTSAYGVPDAWVARRLVFRTDPAAGTPLWTLITAAASEVVVDRIT